MLLKIFKPNWIFVVLHHPEPVGLHVTGIVHPKPLMVGKPLHKGHRTQKQANRHLGHRFNNSEKNEREVGIQLDETRSCPTTLNDRGKLTL